MEEWAAARDEVRVEWRANQKRFLRVLIADKDSKAKFTTFGYKAKWAEHFFPEDGDPAADRPPSCLQTCGYALQCMGEAVSKNWCIMDQFRDPAPDGAMFEGPIISAGTEKCLSGPIRQQPVVLFADRAGNDMEAPQGRGTMGIATSARSLVCCVCYAKLKDATSVRDSRRAAALAAARSELGWPPHPRSSGARQHREFVVNA